MLILRTMQGKLCNGVQKTRVMLENISYARYVRIKENVYLEDGTPKNLNTIFVEFVEELMKNQIELMMK